MRRTLFIIAALLALLPLSAQQTQDALYIYRNDGGFNGFFFDDIEKIEFSRTDTLGIEHQDYVVQEVYALDSIFRIPISAIDSVCFVTPETKYQEGVTTVASTLWDYVIDSDETTQFTLSPSTPASLIPKVGDKLANIQATPHLPYGFFGQVASVTNDASGIIVEAESVQPEALFKQHIIKIAAETDDWSSSESASAARRAGRRIKNSDVHTLSIPELVYDETLERLSLLHPGAIIFSGKGGVRCTMKPKVSARAFASIGWTTGSCYDANFRIETTTDFRFNIDGTLMIRQDIPLFPKTPYPIGATGFFFELEGGLSANLSGNLNLTYTSHNHTSNYAQMSLQTDPYGWVEETPVVDGNVLMSVKNFESSSNLNIKGKISLSLGIYSVGSISLLKKPKLSGRIDAGARISAEVEYDDSQLSESVSGAANTVVYDMLNRDNIITVTPFVTGKAIAAIEGTTWKASYDVFNVSGTPESLCGLVPRFSNLDATYHESSRYTSFSASLSRDLLMDVPIGFAVYDKDGELVSSKWHNEKYNFGYPASYSLDFAGLKKGETYTVYPITKLLDYSLVASPSMKYTQMVEGASLTLDPKEIEFDYDGGQQNFTISTNVEKSDIVSIKATPKNDKTGQWLSCQLGSTSNPSNITAVITAKPNTTDEVRKDTVIVSMMMIDGIEITANIYVTQIYEIKTPPTLAVSRNMITIGADNPLPTEVEITTDASDLTFTKSGGAWLTYSYDKTTHTLTLTAESNTSENTRSCVITVSAENQYGTVEEKISVEQDGARMSYTGLFLSISLPIVGEGETEPRVYNNVLPILYEHNVPVYCTGSVTENGASLLAVGSEQTTMDGGHYNLGYDKDGNPIRRNVTVNIDSKWNITAFINRNGTDDKNDDTVSGTVSCTVDQEDIHITESTGALYYKTTSSQSVSFTFNNVPYYSGNTSIPVNYSGSMNPTCEGYKAGSGTSYDLYSPSQFISGFTSSSTTASGHTTTHLVDSYSTPWSITVGVWDPERGSLKPYGEP